MDSSSTRRGTGTSSGRNGWDKETPRLDRNYGDGEAVDGGRMSTDVWESEQTKIDRDWYNLEDNTVWSPFLESLELANHIFHT